MGAPVCAWAQQIETDHSDSWVVKRYDVVKHLLGFCLFKNTCVEDRWFITFVAITGCFAPTVIIVCVPSFNATQGQEILTSGIWAANECAYQCPEVWSQVSSEWCKVMLGSIFRVATGTMAPNFFPFWTGFIYNLHFLYFPTHSKFETLFVREKCACNSCGHAPCVWLPLWF